MKKTISLFLAIVLCLCLCACGKESPAEDFLYEMHNGEIIITGYCGTDREIYIPAEIDGRPVTTIGEYAFEEYDMTHITIPDSVTLIEEHAFTECTCLSSVEFSDHLERIEDYAFAHCSELKKIALPKSLLCIDEYAFCDCTALKDVSLPDGLEYLAVGSFEDCENLSSLRIPDNTEIDISLITQDAGYVGYVTMLSTPVGSSDTTTYYDSDTNALVGDSEFEPLSTAIVVSKGSYAHSQVAEYTYYGLTVKVE